MFVIRAMSLSEDVALMISLGIDGAQLTGESDDVIPLDDACGLMASSFCDNQKTTVNSISFLPSSLFICPLFPSFFQPPFLTSFITFSLFHILSSVQGLNAALRNE